MGKRKKIEPPDEVTLVYADGTKETFDFAALIAQQEADYDQMIKGWDLDERS